MSTAHVETTPLDDVTIPRQGEPTDTAGLAVVLEMPGTREDVRDGRLVDGQRRRLDVRARQLGRLMERRPELRGAYAPADLALASLLTDI